MKLTIKGNPDYKMPSADKVLEDDVDSFILRLMTQTMIFMTMHDGDEFEAESLITQ